MAMTPVRLAVLTFSLLAVAGLFSSCAATKQARSVEASNFLEEYRPLLQPGKAGEEAVLFYRNPQANWAAYDKILLAPVTVWDNPANPLSTDARKDLQTLVDSFHYSLAEKLSKDYRMVAGPARGALHIQIAIGHVETGTTALTVVSKAIPHARLANTLWTFGSGKPAFAGEVTIEYVVKDTATGEVLSAGADRRVGGTNLFDKEVFNSWGDVKNALVFWEDGIVYRLCTLRGGKDCIRPKE